MKAFCFLSDVYLLFLRYVYHGLESMLVSTVKYCFLLLYHCFKSCEKFWKIFVVCVFGAVPDPTARSESVTHSFELRCERYKRIHSDQ